MRSIIVPALACLSLLPTAAVAQEDPFHVTPADRAACTPDAVRLCSAAYPDEVRLVACMSANRASLAPGCASALASGKRERGLR